MGLLTNLLLLPVTGPYRGLRFLLECIQEQVDAERLDESRIRADLMALSLRLELGELSEEDYLAAEAVLLDQLNQARAAQEELAIRLQDIEEGMVDADRGVETDALDRPESSAAAAESE